MQDLAPQDGPEDPLRALRLRVEYAGGRFAGWQIQPEARTAQGELERALTELTGAPVRVFGASRTDAGVHALGQVASCELRTPLPPARILAGLNALLPEDIAVAEVEEAPPGFHARFSAQGKHYRYRILNRPARAPGELSTSLHIPTPLDLGAMQEAAAALEGRHDFRAFVSKPDGDGDCTRTLHRVEVSREPLPGGGALVALDVVGDGFLYKMVRTIAGTLCQVGKGRLRPADLARILTSQDRRQAGPTAPPQGLFLMRVFYDREELPELRAAVVTRSRA